MKSKKKKPVVKDSPSKTYLPVRILPEQIERIDAIRPDMIPREPFVRHVLDIGLSQLEEEG
jgi:hypothetical protein